MLTQVKVIYEVVDQWANNVLYKHLTELGEFLAPSRNRETLMLFLHLGGQPGLLCFVGDMPTFSHIYFF